MMRACTAPPGSPVKLPSAIAVQLIANAVRAFMAGEG